jgi:formamidopyrimidine-DNA glycosylase
MPELPEVELYRRLAAGALGRVISDVHSPDPWFLKGGVDGAAIRGALVGRSFTDARRIGKLLLIEVDDGPTVGIRFGMTGNLAVDGTTGVDQLRNAPRRHDAAWDRWGVGFADGGSLVVRDPRRLGGVFLDPDVSRLGPDAATLTTGQLARALGGSSAPLKARLLDQSRLSGVGNLIADEVLWRAGLSPERPAGSLTDAEVGRLRGQITRTVGRLVDRGGSHLTSLMEHRQTGGRCPRDGTPLQRATIGGRTTWWCPTHQV